MVKPRFKRGVMTQEKFLLKHGVRSKSETRLGEQLTALDIPYSYESVRLPYVITHKYTPDFAFECRPNFFVECKGYMEPEDRTKHLLIKKQHPHIEIAFVFDNPRLKLDSKSKTTYAQWCERHGFKWAEKSIPLEWFQ